MIRRWSHQISDRLGLVRRQIWTWTRPVAISCVWSCSSVPLRERDGAGSRDRFRDDVFDLLEAAPGSLDA